MGKGRVFWGSEEIGLAQGINTVISVSGKEFDTREKKNSLRNQPQHQSTPWILPGEHTGALPVLRLFSDRPVLANENVGRDRTVLQQYSQAQEGQCQYQVTAPECSRSNRKIILERSDN